MSASIHTSPQPRNRALSILGVISLIGGLQAATQYFADTFG
jgi:hypothetical protein